MAKRKNKFTLIDGIFTLITIALWPVFAVEKTYKGIKNFQRKNANHYEKPSFLHKIALDKYPPGYFGRSNKIIFPTKLYKEVIEHEFVSIDIETTGLNRELDYIIEIAAIHYIDGVEADKFVTLVKPDISIPPEATKINGISNFKVFWSPKIDDVLPDLIEFIGDKILVAHNAKFDIDFLETWSSRLEIFQYWNYIDTIEVAKKALGKLPNYKQETVLDAIGYRQFRKHRAEDDCRGCAQILLYALDNLDIDNFRKTDKNSKQSEKLNFEASVHTIQESGIVITSISEKKYPLLDIEKEFIYHVFEAFDNIGLYSSCIDIDRKADGTLNFCYNHDGNSHNQFGRIKLCGKKTKIQIIQYNSVVWLEDESTEVYYANALDWAKRVKKWKFDI